MTGWVAGLREWLLPVAVFRLLVGELQLHQRLVVVVAVVVRVMLATKCALQVARARRVVGQPLLGWVVWRLFWRLAALPSVFRAKVLAVGRTDVVYLALGPLFLHSVPQLCHDWLYLRLVVGTGIVDKLDGGEVRLAVKLKPQND